MGKSLKTILIRVNLPPEDKSFPFQDANLAFTFSINGSQYYFGRPRYTKDSSLFCSSPCMQTSRLHHHPYSHTAFMKVDFQTSCPLESKMNCFGHHETPILTCKNQVLFMVMLEEKIYIRDCLGKNLERINQVPGTIDH